MPTCEIVECGQTIGEQQKTQCLRNSAIFSVPFSAIVSKVLVCEVREGVLQCHPLVRRKKC